MRRSYTAEEFAAMQARIATATQQRRPVQEAKPSRRNKYGAQATVVDGQRFDSKSEAKRFVQLRIMEKAKLISDLQTQVVFDLLPAQDVGGTKERPMRYVCDFTYIDGNGRFVVEDVKSGPTKTAEYRLKRKLMLFFHQIAITEVLMDL